MSYLSPLPHYPTPRLARARSYVHVPSPFPFDDELWDPRPHLLHPLHAYPISAERKGLQGSSGLCLNLSKKSKEYIRLMGQKQLLIGFIDYIAVN
ncbi:hypothetical protein ANCCAN_19796 [Ancylostoma caninum]|uniref:Uncharacterized protein n=1 Tax=Ancylostoma caninum TaxID=29170 RepID=A0A368FQC3_ANCCA|nr:hypothetical protein ANCCAN_19796 [Ancylostoma caninum]